MISARNLYPSNFILKIIWSIILTWPFKLSILSNYTEHPKKLVLFIIYITFFYNSQISIPNWSASLFGKITSLQEKRWLTQRGQAFETLTNRSNNRDHKDPLGSNKSGSFKAFEALTRSFKTLKAPTRSFKALFFLLPAFDVIWYTQTDMDHLF